MSQRQINVAHTKSLKPNYKGMSPLQKRLVKLQEEHDMLNKSISQTYRIGHTRFGNDFRTHPAFQVDFELIFKWEKRKESILKSIDRAENKHDVQLVDVSHLHNELKRASYGGSF